MCSAMGQQSMIEEALEEEALDLSLSHLKDEVINVLIKA